MKVKAVKFFLGILLSMPLLTFAGECYLNGAATDEIIVQHEASGWSFSFFQQLDQKSERIENLLNLDPSAWRQHPQHPYICGYNTDIELKLEAPGGIEGIDISAKIVNYTDTVERIAVISYSTDGLFFHVLDEQDFGSGEKQLSGTATLSGKSDTIWLRFQRVLNSGDINGRDGYIVFNSIGVALKGNNQKVLSPYTIVIPDHPLNIPRRWSDDYLGAKFEKDLTQKLAAERLQLLIKLATDESVKIVEAKDAPKHGKLIYVGYGNHLDGVISPPTRPEGLKIAEKDGNIFLLGQIVPAGTNNWEVPVDLGVMHAVETFAEKIMGYRFLVSPLQDSKLFELGTAIPKLKELTITPGLLIEDAPVFNTRLHASSLGGPTIDGMIGERTGSSSNFSCNHSYNLEAWTHAYREQFPQMFIPRNPQFGDAAHAQAMGTQVNLDFLDYTEPLVLTKRLEQLDAFFRQKEAANFFAGRTPTSNYVMEEPPDIYPPSYQYNKRSKELFDPKQPLWGEFSNIWFDYVNRLSKEVKTRWPDKRVSTLAYLKHYASPTFELDENIDVMLCMQRSSVSIKEPYIWNRNLNDLQNWSNKVGGRRERLYLWEYGEWPGMFINLPLLTPYSTQKWLQTVRPYISGVMLEFYPNSGQFADYLMGRVWTRLLWNPDMDVAADIKDFCDHFYGPAAETMYAFYQKLIARHEMKWENPGTPIWGQYYVDPELYFGQSYPQGEIRALHAMLNKACRQVGVEPNRVTAKLKHQDCVYLLNEQNEAGPVNLAVGSDGLLLDPTFGWQGGRLVWHGSLQPKQTLKITASDKAELVDADGAVTDVSSQLEGHLPKLEPLSADIIYFWHRGKSDIIAKLELIHGSGINAKPDADTPLARRLNWQRMPYFQFTSGRSIDGFFPMAHLFHTNHGHIPEYKVTKQNTLDEKDWEMITPTELVQGRESSGSTWEVMGYSPWLRTWIRFAAVQEGLMVHIEAEGEAVPNEKLCFQLDNNKIEFMIQDTPGATGLLRRYNKDGNIWQATALIKWSELGLKSAPESMKCQIIRERGTESYIWSPSLNLWVAGNVMSQGPGTLIF